jgi:hypothetical protein
MPQEAATVLLYEDNDACTTMGNAQKPTKRTRHMDIKYFSICEWVDRDLMYLDRIDMAINMANHFTKGLTRALFHRHANFLLGHIPPMYSPVYQLIVGMYTNQFVDIECHFQSHSLLPCVPLQPGFMLRYQKIMQGTLG